MGAPKRARHPDLLWEEGQVDQVGDSGYRLTNKGHDYVEAARGKPVWKETKKRLGVALEFVKITTIRSAATQIAGKLFG